MTRHSSPPPSVPHLSLFLILTILLLSGCGLFEPFSAPAEPAMSVEEALEVEPLDSRPTVLEEMGPPDAFTIQFKELEGQIVRWESWSYFDFTTQFDFIDGELIWTIDIEPVPDGSIYAHFYDPLELQEGMSQADVEALFPEIDFLEIPLDELELEGGIALAGEQILLGFFEDELVYVETVILSPDPEGQPLAMPETPPEPPPAPTLEPTAEPTTQPTAEPSPEPTAESAGGTLTYLRDDFDSEAPLSLTTASEGFMVWEHLNGQGQMTSKAEGGILIAYYQEPLFQDFILEVDITFLDPVAGSKAGVIFRGEDPTDTLQYYYYVAFAPEEQSLVVGVFQDIEWKSWDYYDLPLDLIPADDIYHLEIDCLGNRIAISLDGSLITTLEDSWIPGEGVVGLSLASYQNPETVLFDNLFVIDYP